MVKFVELSLLDTASRNEIFDDSGESLGFSQNAPKTVYVNVASIRSFQEKRGGSGTVLMFNDGKMFSVEQSLADVHAVVIGEDGDTGNGDLPRLTHERASETDCEGNYRG